LKVGGDFVVALHGDGGLLNIGNGAHIIRPVDKAVALFNLGHQLDHLTLETVKRAFPRDGYSTPSGAVHSYIIR